METQKSDYGYFLKGLMVGGLLGGLAGIFLAPRSGKELREEVQQKGREALKEAKNVYSETQSKAKAVLQDSKGILDCIRGKEKAPAVSEYAEENVGEA